MNYKKIGIIILIIVWCIFIYAFSNKNSTDSNSTSKGVITIGLKCLVTTTNKLRITNIDLTSSWLNIAVNKLNYPIRKCAHATIYFVLGILFFIFFSTFNFKNFQIFLLTVLFCFCYSLTDEYHQTFITDRTGQFSDCLIDTTGALVSSSFLYILSRKKYKKIVNCE